MARKPLGINRCRGDDQLQVWSLWQQLLQIAQQEIDIQAALMRLINNDRVVLAQQRITLSLGQQDAIGH